MGLATKTTGYIEKAKEFAEYLRQGAADRDRERRFPHEEMKRLKESGLLGQLIPKEYGGGGISVAESLELTMILAEGDSSVAQMFGGHTLVEVMKDAPQSARERIFRGVVERGLSTCGPIAELGTKHAEDYASRFRKENGKWLFRGRKFYATGCLAADMVMIVGLIEGLDPPQAAVGFVDIDAPGVKIIDDWDGMGQRCTASGTMEFDDVETPEELFMTADSWLKPSLLVPMVQTNFAAIFVGIAKAALRDAVDYVRTKARPAPLSGLDSPTQDPYVLWHVGDMQTRIHSAEEMVLRAGRLIDETPQPVTEETRALAAAAASEAKIVATRESLEVTSRLFQICGSSSTRDRYNYDRHWRNARTLTLHDPVDYKYKVVGDWVLNDNPIPVSGYT